MARHRQVDLGPEAAPRVAQRMVRRLFELRRLRARPACAVGPDFFFAPAAARVARMMVASTHQRSRPMRPWRSRWSEQPGDDAGPGAVLPPAIEAIVDGLPGPVALRDVAPGGAGVQDPEDAVDEGVMILPGMPAAAVMGRMGQERIDPPPETRDRVHSGVAWWASFRKPLPS